MESDKTFTGNEKIEFREIVLQHIRRILEIGSHELRDTTRVVTHANHTETIESEDLRYSYIQAIQNLAYVLIPYFDEDITEVFNKAEFVINAYDFQLQKYFKKTITKIFSEKYGNDKVPIIFFINKKIEYAKKLFIELNKLLHRNNYLASAVYGEEKDDIAEDEEGEKE